MRITLLLHEIQPMLRDETPVGFHDAWAALSAHVKLMLDHLLREHEKAMVLPPAHRREKQRCLRGGQWRAAIDCRQSPVAFCRVP